MRKRVILAFMLVFALVAASSCSLIIKDEEVDKQTPIIEVAGKTFTKAEVNEQVEAVMDYEEYMYSMYGISYDRTDAEHHFHGSGQRHRRHGAAGRAGEKRPPT